MRWVIVTLIVAAFVVVCVAMAQASPVFNFSFQGNYDDTSGNGIISVPINTSLADDRFGNANSAMYLNASTSFMNITIGNIEPSTLSISMWVKPEPQSVYRTLFSKINQYGISATTVDNLYFFNGTNLVPNVATKLTESSWQHYVFMINNTNFTIHKDGIKVTEGKGGFGATNTNNLVIGVHPTYNTWFNATVDEIIAYNKSLSDFEIRTLYYGKPTSNSNIKEICYQESANVSTDCGGLDTGRYGLGGELEYWGGTEHGMYDGDWGTYGEYSLSASYNFLKKNYTKPPMSSGAHWRIKDGTALSATEKIISIPSECFNYDPTQIRLSIDVGTTPSFTRWYCQKSASDYVLLRTGGGLMYEEAIYWDYDMNAIATYEDSITASTSIPLSLAVTMPNTAFSYIDVNATLDYEGTTYTATKSSDANGIYFARTVTAPNQPDDYMVNATWNISYNGGKYDYNFSQTITSANISDCSDASWARALTIYGVDEERLENVSEMKLNINIDAHVGTWSFGGTNIKSYSFEFSGAQNYTICIHPNSSIVQIDAIMEYGGIGDYVDRKYYLYNYTISNQTGSLPLYHLNESKASDIDMTVIRASDGSRMPNSLIKVLRYYPGENVYRVVEVAKTDSLGTTLTKMVLADVFYKYIVEYPPGTILYDGSVEKLSSTSKVLPITQAVTTLSQFNELIRINYNVSCTKSTHTCRFTWNNPSNTEVTGRLTIYRDTGFARREFYRQEVTSAAASIVYVIPEASRTNSFIAEGAIIR
jgi:hypothetical protein